MAIEAAKVILEGVQDASGLEACIAKRQFSADQVVAVIGKTEGNGGVNDFTRILADMSISIDAMVQKEPSEGEEQVDIIMLTHLTQEKNINAAIAGIESLPVVTGKVTRIRLEALGKH